ncbi:uncharacterized protein LOC124877477 isoform X2 [Girardinichthys multiradiatus]|nr:uncharacterized protein LOC124877477 isoform X2 [Girardinichthys multiradiatus]
MEAAIVTLVMTSIFGLPAFGQSLGHPVTTGARGSLTHFYCKPPGCAANVARVFCDDKYFERGPLPDCSGPPQLYTVCQLNGRALVSSPAGSSCEFEEDGAYILTQRCTDIDPICLWIHATSPSPTHSNNGEKAAGVSPGYTAIAATFGVVALLGAIGVLVYCSNRRSRRLNQEQNSDPDVDEHLTDIQPSGDTTERDTEVVVQVDVDAILQRGHGA